MFVTHGVQTYQNNSRTLSRNAKGQENMEWFILRPETKITGNENYYIQQSYFLILKEK
jgi:hypothetical protein